MKSLLALILLIPAPSLGVVSGMILWPDAALGKSLFFCSKIWILIIPLVWHLVVYKDRVSWSPARKGGFGTGALLGIVISLIILVFYLVLGGRLIDPEFMKSVMGDVGLNKLPVYLGGALYWITVNSLLEEFVWRWFVVQESEKLLGSKGAILFSASAFTLHHIVAMKVYFDWPMVVIGSLGIFVGGAVWSWCYIRFRSIWPGYLSHAIVDLAVFGIGYAIIF